MYLILIFYHFIIYLFAKIIKYYFFIFLIYFIFFKAIIINCLYFQSLNESITIILESIIFIIHLINENELDLIDNLQFKHFDFQLSIHILDFML